MLIGTYPFRQAALLVCSSGVECHDSIEHKGMITACLKKLQRTVSGGVLELLKVGLK